MELFKNTSLITFLWITLGIMLIVVGVYRDYLYRDEDTKQKNMIINLQENLIEIQKAQVALQQETMMKQTRLQQTLDAFVKEGKISQETAKEILKVELSDNVSVTDNVEMKLSPVDKSIGVQDSIELKLNPPKDQAK